MPEQEHTGLTGILVPVVTPFDPETGECAPVSFRENIRKWLARPIDGIVVFGSTGEGVLLDDDEKERLLGYARELVPATKPLVAGAGADSTRATIRQVKRLAAAGADAVLVHSPPYFAASLTPAALREHYVAIADASPIPVILYHIPKFMHQVFEPGLVGELSRHPNIVGLKDSSGDLKRFAEYADQCGEDFRLFIGSGANLYTALELGATGGIVALGLLAPEECSQIVEHYRRGESRKAGEIQERIAPVHREIVAKYGAAGVKAALEVLGFAGGPPRRPLQPRGPRQKEEVARVLQEAGLV